MTSNGYPPANVPPAPHAYAPHHAAPGGPPAGGYGAPPAGGFGAPPAGGFGAPPGNPYGPAPFGPTPGYSPAYGVGPAGYGYAAHAGGERPVTNGAPSLRWWILASFVGAFAAIFLGGAVAGVADGDDTVAGIGSILTLIGVLSFAVYGVTVLAWIYKSWEMLPPSMRVTDSGKHVTPGQAVGFLFIPFYNLYWYFVVSAGLCSALNRALAMHGSPKRAPGGLAIAAAVVQVIPYVNMLAPMLWIPFVFVVESAKREYARVASVRPGLG